jgi:hypothetical protein
MHYGDGTDNLIEQHQLEWIEHYTAGQEYEAAYQAQEFLLSTPDKVTKMRDCDIILSVSSWSRPAY